jgi:ABC-type nitrate/sulfonate/bicarbonate transport system permease component
MLGSRSAVLTNVGAVLFAAAVLLAWQYCVDQRILSPIFVASPFRIGEALADLATSGELWNALGPTLARMLGGWTAAAVVGIALGAMVGLSTRLALYLGPTLEFCRQLPAAVVISPAILLLGLSEQMMVCVIAFGAAWPILLATVHGFGAIDHRLREVALVMEMTMPAYVRKVAFPAATPEILAGVRISLAVALILTVVVEMQAGLPGMGRLILLAQRGYRAPDLYAGIIVLGAFGFLLNMLASRGEQYVLRWRTVTR